MLPGRRDHEETATVLRRVQLRIVVAREYANLLSASAKDRSPFAFGDNAGRLRAVKKRYDPQSRCPDKTVRAR